MSSASAGGSVGGGGYRLRIWQRQLPPSPLFFLWRRWWRRRWSWMNPAVVATAEGIRRRPVVGFGGDDGVGGFSVMFLFFFPFFFSIACCPIEFCMNFFFLLFFCLIMMQPDLIFFHLFFFFLPFFTDGRRKHLLIFRRWKHLLIF
jgi:hypothetical protein